MHVQSLCGGHIFSVLGPLLTLRHSTATRHDEITCLRTTNTEWDCRSQIGVPYTERQVPDDQPLLQSPDLDDEVAVSGRVLLYHVFNVIGLERVLKATPGGHHQKLQKIGVFICESNSIHSKSTIV